MNFNWIDPGQWIFGLRGLKPKKELWSDPTTKFERIKCQTMSENLKAFKLEKNNLKNSIIEVHKQQAVSELIIYSTHDQVSFARDI
jgi:hypothetical protein